MKPGARQRFVEGLQERRARHKERHHLIRVVAAIGGFLIVLLGIILIPLPGPGLLIVAVGLAVLALEFTWAEQLLERTVDRLSEAGRGSSARAQSGRPRSRCSEPSPPRPH